MLTEKDLLKNKKTGAVISRGVNGWYYITSKDEAIGYVITDDIDFENSEARKNLLKSDWEIIKN